MTYLELANPGGLVDSATIASCESHGGVWLAVQTIYSRGMGRVEHYKSERAAKAQFTKQFRDGPNIWKRVTEAQQQGG